ncbi:MAG: hypothetical protein U0R19_15980 [Bryobacteraceae bacterium]
MTAEAFAELPEKAKRDAAVTIDMLDRYPRIHPIRRRGVMRGYRFFVAGRFLVYYRVTSEEVQIAAVIPGMMRSA